MISIDRLFDNPLYIGLVAAMLIVIAVIIHRTSKMPYVACDALLTRAELKFYNQLRAVVPNHTAIMMKVRMGDIITCTDVQWRAGWGPRISAKHIDFVLIDPITTVVKVAIELDDSTHRTNSDRIKRDKFVNKAFEVAGVTLLRIPVQKYYDRNSLMRLVNETMA